MTLGSARSGATCAQNVRTAARGSLVALVALDFGHCRPAVAGNLDIDDLRHAGVRVTHLPHGGFEVIRAHMPRQQQSGLGTSRPADTRWDRRRYETSRSRCCRARHESRRRTPPRGWSVVAYLAERMANNTQDNDQVPTLKESSPASRAEPSSTTRSQCSTMSSAVAGAPRFAQPLLRVTPKRPYQPPMSTGSPP